MEVCSIKTIEISDSLIYFIGDKSKYSGSYSIDGSMEEGNLTNPSIDVVPVAQLNCE